VISPPYRHPELGGAVSAFAKPDALDAAYGKSPMGFTLFAKFSLGH
jgi:hypothetical protein